MNWDLYKAGGENWPILSSYSKKEEICDQIYNPAGLCPIFQQWSRNSLREKFRELRFLPKYISSMYIIQADHPHHLDHPDLMYHWDHPGHLDWQLTDLENNYRIKKFSFTYVQHKFAKNNLTGMTNYKIWNIINNNKFGQKWPNTVIWKKNSHKRQKGKMLFRKQEQIVLERSVRSKLENVDPICWPCNP